ncbi:MAG: PTS sugar transporter subunit IIC [Candidatus Krumholzibacteria bacterium]|nr:PTS sugar transporter subunit IIC [Candidatus Krumholzibacteria bacterium]
MQPLLITAGIAAALSFEYRTGMRIYLSMPLVSGALVGIALGAPEQGALAGLMMQVLFLGSVRLRGRLEPDLPAAGALAAAVYATVVGAEGGFGGFEGLALFWSLCAGIAVARLGAAAYRRWERIASGPAARAAEAAMRGRTGFASAVHLGLSLSHAAWGAVIVLALFHPALAAVRILSSNLEVFAAGSIAMLPLLLPCAGAGSLLRLYADRSYVVWFAAGCLVAAVWFVFGGR